jgi:predicted dehydrogenase
LLPFTENINQLKGHFMTKILTKQTIGVGVAGTGFIGPAHIEGLRRNGINVLGLSEETKEKAKQKAAELGIPRYYDSLNSMLADPDIDVVHITQPPASPARQSIFAGRQACDL